jgi:hypothetical protein
MHAEMERRSLKYCKISNIYAWRKGLCISNISQTLYRVRHRVPKVAGLLSLHAKCQDKKDNRHAENLKTSIAKT